MASPVKVNNPEEQSTALSLLNTKLAQQYADGVNMGKQQAKLLKDQEKLWEQINGTTDSLTSSIGKSAGNARKLVRAFEQLYNTYKDAEKEMMRADPRFKPAYSAYRTARESEITKLPAGNQQQLARDELAMIAGLKASVHEFKVDSMEMLKRKVLPYPSSRAPAAGEAERRGNFYQAWIGQHGGRPIFGDVPLIGSKPTMPDELRSRSQDIAARAGLGGYYRTSAIKAYQRSAREQAETARSMELLGVYAEGKTGRMGVPYLESSGGFKKGTADKKPEKEGGMGAGDILALMSGYAGAIYESAKWLWEGYGKVAKFMKPSTEALEGLSATARTIGTGVEDVGKMTLGGSFLGRSIGYSRHYADLGYGQEDISTAIGKYGLLQGATTASAASAVLSQTGATGAIGINQWADIMHRMAGASVMGTGSGDILDFAKTMKASMGKALKDGIPAEQYFTAYGKALATAVGLGLDMSPEELAKYIDMGTDSGYAPLRTGQSQTQAMQEYSKMADKITSEPFEIGALSRAMGGGPMTAAKIMALGKSGGVELPDMNEKFAKAFDTMAPVEQLGTLRNWGILQKLLPIAMTMALNATGHGAGYAPLFMDRESSNQYQATQFGMNLTPRAGRSGPFGLDPTNPDFILDYMEKASAAGGLGMAPTTTSSLTVGREIGFSDMAKDLVASDLALGVLGGTVERLNRHMVDLGTMVGQIVDNYNKTHSVASALRAGSHTEGAAWLATFMPRIDTLSGSGDPGAAMGMSPGIL